MEGNQKPKQSFRLSSLWQRKRKTATGDSARITPSQSSQGTSVQALESADTQRTRNRYSNAAKFLQDAIKAHGGEQWQGLPLSKLEGEIQGFNDPLLRKHIDEALESQNISIKDQGALEKCMHTMQCIVTAMSPFAKNFLTILTHGSNVYLLSIFR
jgi:hypothetical protein